MDKQTRMTGIRLGFTYAAGIVLLACLVAVVAGQGASTPATAQAGATGSAPLALGADGSAKAGAAVPG